MKIKTRCEHCGKIYNMSDEYIGQTAQCKVCQKYFLMTVLEEAPLPPPPAPPAEAQFAAPNPAAPQFPAADLTQYPAPPPAGGFPQYGQAPQGQPAFGAEQPQFGGQPGFGQAPPMQQPQFGGQQPQFGGQQFGGQQPQFGGQQFGGQQPQFGQPFDTAFQDQAPRYGASPAAASPIGAPQPGQTSPVATQTVVCPKCKFTAEIPPVSNSMRIRCQECGKKFVIKPLRKGKPVGAPKPAKSGGGGSRKSVLGLLFIVVLLAAVVFVGPTLLPDLIPNILPF
ncbi:MAG: zinc-ribbon domain-containing protein [Candidatus Adiutrix sp.]|jgi:DNA-directed RNA polymerase subunit RPC12/RpoP|nr:zinc-ribbon domain-containing protein [Candidatus Adiutrix sp.]